MDTDTLLSLFLATLLVKITVELVLKSPSLITRPFFRLWEETTYLQKVLYKKPHNKRFAQWKPQTARCVALRAIKAQGAEQEIPQSVLDLLESFLKRGTPVVLLGEPGAGKTTALEALTYRIARRAYRYDISLWFGLLLIAALLLFAFPVLTILWLVSFFLWESFVRRATVPLFLEARYYTGAKIKEWVAEVFEEHWGGKPPWGSYNRVVWLVDGVNEVLVNLYPIFVERWRGLLQDKSAERVVFTSRAGEDPTPGLGLSNSLTVLDLDNPGVHKFLRVYGREKAVLEKQPYANGQAERDFDELRNKNLLGERGIGRNPYWLKMIVESGLYTRNRGVLFRKFAEELINREIGELEGGKGKPPERKRKPDWKTVKLEVEMDALANLALAMHAEQRIGLSDEAGWNKARTAIRESVGDAYSPDDVLGEAEAATLVRVRFKERVEFVHQLVQEFFAAYALRHETKWQIALDHAEDVWWWQTLFILGGLISTDGLPIYGKFARQVLGYGKNDHRLCAAIGLLQSVENPPTEVSNAVITRLVESVGEALTPEQQRAMQELGRILGDEAAEVFGVLFRASDRRSKTKGAALLCAVGGKHATEILLAAMHNRDEWNMTTGILGSIGAPAVKPLITALHDQDNHVHRDAVDALVKIGSASIEPLIKLLQDREVTVRSTAAYALGRYALVRKFSDQRPVKALIDALRDRDHRVRCCVAEALGIIRDPSAVEPLIKVLNEHYNDVCWHAAFALGEIGDQRALLGLGRVAWKADSREDAGRTDWGNVADVALEAIEKIQRRTARG